MITDQVSSLLDIQRSLMQTGMEIRKIQPWDWIQPSWFNPVALSNKTIQVGSSDAFDPGTPIQFVQDNAPKYAVATSLTSNVLTLGGAPLSTTTPIQAMFVGKMYMGVDVKFSIAGDYASSIHNALRIVGRQLYTWGRSTAYLCRARAAHIDVAGTTQPEINIQVGGNDVFASDIVLSGTTSTWVDSGVTDVTYYQVDLDDDINVYVNKAGTGTAAEDLSVVLQFVME